MKKLKLFMATFALILGWSSASAVTGSELTATMNDVFLYNVGAGNYLSAGDWWGTHATIRSAGMDLDLTKGDGVYTIGTRQDKRYLNGEWMDGTSCNFTFTEVDAENHYYTISYESDGTKYLYYVDETVGSGTSVDGNNYYWQVVTRANFLSSLAGATEANPKDATGAIYNAGFFCLDYATAKDTDFPATRSWQGTKLTDTWGYRNNEKGVTSSNYCVEQYGKAFDNYQTLTGMPNGAYVVKNQGFYKGTNPGYLYANDKQIALTKIEAVPDAPSGYTGNDLQRASWEFGKNDGCHNTAPKVVVTNGNLRIGTKSENGAGTWYCFDNFTLEYYGTCLVNDAIALPGGGAMAADTWYYFDIDAAADNYLATATELGDIICTDDGDQVTSSVTTGNVTLTATDNSFAAKRYYVKSSSANNLEIGVASYSYSVSEASVDKTYIQPSQTVTVSFTASTNKPGATLDQNYDGVTFDGAEIDITPDASGFTFTAPANLTANAEHTLYIPAGAIGYDEGGIYNAEQSITLKAPAVFDGVYYLYDATNKQFLGRGANYGCRAVADKYGIPMTVATNASNITTFKFLDNDLYLFDANEGNIYTDNSTYPNFAVVSTTGGYYVVNKNTTGTSTYGYKLYIDGSSNVVASNDKYTVWTFKTSSQRDAIVNAYPTDNINTVITAAGISTTAAEFKSYLSNNYTEVDKTSEIGTARFTGAVGNWTWSQVRGQDNQPAYGTDFAELWVATGTYSQTVDKANLPAGIYKVTVDGYERRATNDKSNTLGAAGYNLVSSYLAANDEQVRLTDWYNTSKPGNTGGAVTAFNNGEATNELYIYLDGNTDLEIKLVKPNYVWDCWTIFNNFTLTYYDHVKTAKIGETGWTTFSCSAPLDLSNMTASTGDVAAYYASATSTESVTVLPISSTVQAGEGLLLKGTPNATITIPVVVSGDAISGNLMVGCPTAASITKETANYDKCYVLGIEEEKAVFQNIKNYCDAGNTVSVPAGKAYLNATSSNGARALRISFGGITGVENVEAAAEVAKKNGAYLENGKIAIYKNGMKFSATGAKLK